MKTLEQTLSCSDEELRYDWTFSPFLQVVWTTVDAYIEFVHGLLLMQQKGGRLLEYQVADAFHVEFLFKLLPPGSIEWLLTLIDEGRETDQWLMQEFCKREPEAAVKYFGVSMNCVQAWARGEVYDDQFNKENENERTE